MPFSHEKLIVYQRSIEFIVWLEPILQGLPSNIAAKNQLDRASTSVPLNIAEGNGKFSPKDRARFFQFAQGSALECAAALDVLVAKQQVGKQVAADGKVFLEEVVNMLMRMLDRLDSRVSDCRIAEEPAEFFVTEEEEEEEEEEIAMTATLQQADLLFPLSHFCRASGYPLPACDFIDGATMPEPYRALLVHNGDMTSRLEEFHGAPMTLRVLHRETYGDAYRREVLLCKADDGLPVEYGAIEIDLSAFDESLRAQILEGHQPLGGLLNRAGVRYRSEPRAFLKLAPDSAMGAHFELDGAHTLYGRSNVLLGDGDRVLARIVEVLRP